MSVSLCQHWGPANCCLPLLTPTISGMSVVGTGSPSLEWDGMGHGVNQHTSMHTGAHFHALHNTNALVTHTRIHNTRRHTRTAAHAPSRDTVTHPESMATLTHDIYCTARPPERNAPAQAHPCRALLYSAGSKPKPRNFRRGLGGHGPGTPNNGVQSQPPYLISRWRVCFRRYLLYFINSKRAEVFFLFFSVV